MFIRKTMFYNYITFFIIPKHILRNNQGEKINMSPRERSLMPDSFLCMAETPN